MTKKILVTGAAGFIGSHVVDRLIQDGNQVVAYDNLSQGDLKYLSRWNEDPLLEFVKGDVTDTSKLREASRDCDVVFHLAANPEVRQGDPSVHFRQNVYATHCLLEAASLAGAKDFVFTSSSTVYGEAKQLPTPENYSPLIPISMYGASKLASEAIISGICNTSGMRGLIFRLANVIGPRLRHGVIFDFIDKLRKDPTHLDVLGDGTQKKSYIYVTDCIEGMSKAFQIDRGALEVYNLGSSDSVNVPNIARTVIDEMNLKDVGIEFKGGPDGRGWIGDVKTMLLDSSKIRSLGWNPKYSSSEAVKESSRALLREN